MQWFPVRDGQYTRNCQDKELFNLSRVDVNQELVGNTVAAAAPQIRKLRWKVSPTNICFINRYYNRGAQLPTTTSFWELL